jgi:pimeloyl-ACP methyl ester carboxylesterase
MRTLLTLASLGLLATAGSIIDLPRRSSAPPESHECCEVEYGAVCAPSGHRLRTIVTRPKGRTGRQPAILFTAWLSCDSVELGPGAADGWSRFQQALVTDSGAIVMRVDKEGVGDSEGNCAHTDYETEVAGYAAAFDQLAARDDVDPDRLAIVGGSIGGATAPLVAQGRKLRAVAVWGTFSKTWLEHMLELERRRLTLSGDTPAAVNEKLRGLVEFHALFLTHRLLPREVLAQRPALAPLWYGEPESLYGRPAAFHHQLQAQNILAAWERVDAVVLSVHGAFDWIMSRDDQQLIADVVNRRHHGSARFVEIAKTDHHFTQYDTPEQAFQEKGGRVSIEAIQTIVSWVHDTLAPRAASADAFRASVQPVLARRCTPCHFPGGAMYGRIPFDDAEAVRSHVASVLRRLSGDDRQVVEAWSSQQR